MAEKFEFDIKEIEENLRYLNLLSEKFPNIGAASSEIINLKAILNLPKGSEYFLSDLHGEHESFDHVLRNASGIIKDQIDEVFESRLTKAEKKSLATLIYYPEEKTEMVIEKESDVDDWYEKTLYQLIAIARHGNTKYSHSKVRKALPKDFAYIIDELLYERDRWENKKQYYKEIIKTIIDIDRARAFIIALSNLIQRLAVDRLHIIGDIYDRGPGAEQIMDTLMAHHSVDIQWGNHDILWMGAASGSEACIANVLRISLRYASRDTLEYGYGINLLPLATLAMEKYRNEHNPKFQPKITSRNKVNDKDLDLMRKMHKAILIIQLKLEGQAIKRRPDFNMADRLVLEVIDFSSGIITLDGKKYVLNETSFPTVDPEDPYRLTPEEELVVQKLKSSFQHSEKLQQHIRFLLAKGSMYLIYNSNLLMHGLIPMNADGTFQECEVQGVCYKGKAYIDHLDRLVREAYSTKHKSPLKRYLLDMMWYLWCGPNSPFFGKSKMATFESYFLDDEESHKEVRNPYFDFRDDESVCDYMLKEFGLDPHKSHIINGHVPVKVKHGEKPIKANGKMLVIDGGFSTAYQPKTGIAGYTLIYDSQGMKLVSHDPFESTQRAIEEETDIHSSTAVFKPSEERMCISNTDIGQEILCQIDDLKLLMFAYKKGFVKERK